MVFTDSCFHPKDKIMILQQPGNDTYSNIQIAWFNHIMATENIVLSHAFYGSNFKIGAGKVHVPVAPHRLYKSLKMVSII